MKPFREMKDFTEVVNISDMIETNNTITIVGIDLDLEVDDNIIFVNCTSCTHNGDQSSTIVKNIMSIDLLLIIFLNT